MIDHNLNTDQSYGRVPFFALFSKWDAVERVPTGLKMSIAAVGAIALLTMLAGTAIGQTTNVVHPTDPVIASSANSPGSENAQNAIDGTQAKYLNFDSAANSGLTSGFVVTPAVGPTWVNGLAMQSANDSPERDPKEVTLEGSNDDVADYTVGKWTQIVDIQVPPYSARFQTQTFTFSNYDLYKHYRWTVVECQGPAQNSMQIAEVQFLTTTPPQSARDPILLQALYNAESNNIMIIWPNEAAGYTLESKFGINSNWTAVAGVPNPIRTTGFTNLDVVSGDQQFYRVSQASTNYIVLEPADQTVPLGAFDVGFNVVVSKPPPLSYQWSFNGVDIQQATNSSYTIPHAITLADIGYYQVLIDAETNLSKPAYLAATGANVNTGPNNRPIYFTSTAGTPGGWKCDSGASSFNQKYLAQYTAPPYTPYLVYGPTTSSQTGPWVNSAANSPQVTPIASTPGGVGAFTIRLLNNSSTAEACCGSAGASPPYPFIMSSHTAYRLSVLYNAPANVTITVIPGYGP